MANSFRMDVLLLRNRSGITPFDMLVPALVLVAG
jgi:hypothetical protein